MPEANVGEISIRCKQLGCRTFCSDSRCAYVGDAGTFVRLLLGPSSNLHILMEVETMCLRWATPALPLCPVVALLAKNKREAFEYLVEACCRIHTVLLQFMIVFGL